jgi:uncharacterized iron-regulated membrane protein
MSNPRIASRKLHRWGALTIAIPFLLVLLTGLLLQVKKQVTWVQPPEQEREAGGPLVAHERLLEIARSVPQAGVRGWEDIDRLDFRPSKGVVKVLANSRWEMQVDLRTGELLQTAYRRSDLIEDLHTGGWFSEGIKLWLFFPAALIVTVLWVTGMYMALVHYRAVRRRPRVDLSPAGERVTDHAAP